MFCRHCGAALLGRSCEKCGAPADSSATLSPSTPEQPTRNASRRIGIILVAVCVVLLFFAMMKSPTESSTSKSSETSASVRHKVGEDVEVGYWSYICSGTSWKTSIGSYSMSEYPDAKFLVIDLMITNNDKTASVMPPIKLIDAEGHEYDESSKGVFVEHSFGMLKDLNPGVTSHGYVVFDVPPERAYALKVSGGFTSAETALIDLQ